MAPQPNIIAVCGPTASGKTTLAVAIARAVDGEILSVDSRQVYRGMDIGTGKDREEYRTGGPAVPCHLIDIADPTELFTLWQYQKAFYAAFEGIRTRGTVPIAAGGTGLYLEAVLKNYEVPNVPEDAAFRRHMMQLDGDALAALLRRESPDIAARTDFSSRKRIVRALEVARAQREGDVEWGHPEAPRLQPLVLGVRWPRPVLHERIAARLDSRLDAGMVDEVAALRGNGVPDERLDMFGMEYRHITRHLRGEATLGEMREHLFRDICRLAKRQETYFRGMERRGIPVHWIDGGDSARALSILKARWGLERMGA